jgi:hypothetical protein
MIVSLPLIDVQILVLTALATVLLAYAVSLQYTDFVIFHMKTFHSNV